MTKLTIWYNSCLYCQCNNNTNNMAKWELKYYWDDGATIECRYFNTKKEAKAYAEAEGYPMESYLIVPNK